MLHAKLHAGSEGNESGLYNMESFFESFYKGSMLLIQINLLNGSSIRPCWKIKKLLFHLNIVNPKWRKVK